MAPVPLSASFTFTFLLLATSRTRCAPLCSDYIEVSPSLRPDIEVAKIPAPKGSSPSEDPVGLRVSLDREAATIIFYRGVTKRLTDTEFLIILRGLREAEQLEYILKFQGRRENQSQTTYGI